VVLSFRDGGQRLRLRGHVLQRVLHHDSDCGQRVHLRVRHHGELLAWIIGWDLVLNPNPSIIKLPAVIIILLMSLLIIGIQESARVNGLIVAVKVVIVIIVIAVGFGYINQANYHPFVPPNTGKFGEFGISGVMRAAAVVFFAFIGFDAVSTAAQEARRPQRDMPSVRFSMCCSPACSPAW